MVSFPTVAVSLENFRKTSGSKSPCYSEPAAGEMICTSPRSLVLISYPKGIMVIGKLWPPAAVYYLSLYLLAKPVQDSMYLAEVPTIPVPGMLSKSALIAMK